jgi:hypothetical protein
MFDIRFNHVVPITRDGATSVENLQCCPVSGSAKAGVVVRDRGQLIEQPRPRLTQLIYASFYVPLIGSKSPCVDLRTSGRQMKVGHCFTSLRNAPYELPSVANSTKFCAMRTHICVPHMCSADDCAVVLSVLLSTRPEVRSVAIMQRACGHTLHLSG